MTDRDGKAKNELKVFISGRDSTCGECGEDLGRHAWITLQEDKGAVCLTCADMDHLVFLASGDAALTRRARRHSRLSAVVPPGSGTSGRGCSSRMRRWSGPTRSA